MTEILCTILLSVTIHDSDQCAILVSLTIRMIVIKVQYHHMTVMILYFDYYHMYGSNQSTISLLSCIILDHT